jgi:Phosphoesterase family
MPATSSNLRFVDFPADYSRLPTVAYVIPDMDHEMHNGMPERSIRAGDAWLRENIGAHYRWAKTRNSLLIVTFDENDDKSGYRGLTDPAITISVGMTCRIGYPRLSPAPMSRPGLPMARN